MNRKQSQILADIESEFTRLETQIQHYKEMHKQCAIELRKIKKKLPKSPSRKVGSAPGMLRYKPRQVKRGRFTVQNLSEPKKRAPPQLSYVNSGNIQLPSRI